MSNLIASNEEYERRISICKPCENFKVVLGVNQCNLCGCLLAAKAKLQSSECPINKWE